MPVARRLRGLWTAHRLARDPAGRLALAVLRDPPEQLAAAPLSETEQRALDRAIAGAVLSPKALESRIVALDAADHALAGDLLDRAIALRPANAALVAIGFDSLRARGDVEGVLDLARRIVADPRRPADALLRAIVALDRAGLAPDDPLLLAAWRHFAAAAARDRPRGLVEARLFRALGLPGHARQALLGMIDKGAAGRARARLERELARIALGQDRRIRDQAAVERAVLVSPGLNATVAASRRAALDAVGSSIANPAFLRREPRGVEALLAPTAVAAFEHLLAREPPDARYAPENRLLMVGNSLGGGGMERVMSETYRHFASSAAFERVDLALIDWADEGPRAFYRELAGVPPEEVLRLREGGDARHPSTLLPSGWRDLVQHLHDHIAKSRPRAIHAWNDLTGLFASFAGLLAGCPRILVHFHHLPLVPQSGRTRDIASYPDCYRLLLGRPETRFLFCSEAAAEEYARWWCAERDDRFPALYNGLAPLKADMARGLAIRSSLGIPADAPVIGSVFRFDPVKQPERWAEAAIALAARLPRAHFLLVGDGPLRAETEARVAAAGLAGRVHFPGQTAAVADHLAAMDLFWLTSRTEGLPTAIIEAQMAGVPALAFDVGGVGETLRDGVTGRLVAADDEAALVEASLAALGDARWRRKASRKAAAFARERFAREGFFSALEQIYQS